MKFDRRIMKCFIIAFAVILLFSFVFISFAPHSHEGCESECNACVMQDHYRNIFNTVMLCVLLCASVAKGFGIRDILNNILLSFTNTPVELKVKLSN